MTQVPYTFGNESSPIPLSQLDANFAVIPNYANTAGNVVNAAQANITSVGDLTSLSVVGNTISGNVSTAGQVSATGDVTGGNILTGGAISAYGSITGGSLSIAGGSSLSGALAVGGNLSAGNISTAGQVSAVSNVTGGNINTIGQISAQGNILTQSQVSATGNIVTAGYFVGNFLGNVTGNITAAGSNTQVLFNDSGTVFAVGGLTYNKGSNTLTVLGIVSARGNVIAGNVLSTGSLSLTGNIIADYAQFSGVVTAPTPISSAANNQIATTAFVNTKVGTLGTMSTQNANSVAITGGTIGNGILSLATISTSNIASSTITNTTLGTVNIANANITNANVTNVTISGLINPLSVTDGGTGLGSITQNAVVVGNGTAALQTVSPGTNGNVLTSNGTTWTSVALPAATTGLGFGGTTWHNLTGSRSFNTAYVNSYSYPIAVSATSGPSTSSSIQAYVNGILISWFNWQFNGLGDHGGAFIIVPPGATYQLNSGQGLVNWVELY